MKELLSKIKSKGYWKVIIRPTVYNEQLISSLQDCKELIRSSKVSLRGWDYPHIDPRGINAASTYSVHSICDWPEGPAFEYWRFYQTGQFIHLFAMREDLRITEEQKQNFQDEFSVKNDKFLSILSTLYSVTEIFEFSARLFSKIENVKDVEINIELHGVNNRLLIFWDSFSRWLNRPYICNFSDDTITIKKIFNKDDVIKNSSDLALDFTMKIFHAFNWDSVNKEIFIEDQKKLLERRL